MNFKFQISNSTKGIAALLTIVIIGAAALLMAFSASILGLGDLDMGYVAQKGKQASAFADACLEEGLHRLRLDENYSGNALSLGENSCIISITAQGQDRIIVVESQLGDFYEKKQAELTLNNNSISLSSWEVISD
ncbi:hypothetical protein C0581_02560 [Candidatus Parcubacteria bacterium]|nr:MAG: hypothetical protein C0581_02560 [Candidatus Parcubacteria bacterium]